MGGVSPLHRPGAYQKQMDERSPFVQEIVQVRGRFLLFRPGRFPLKLNFC